MRGADIIALLDASYTIKELGKTGRILGRNALTRTRAENAGYTEKSVWISSPQEAMKWGDARLTLRPTGSGCARMGHQISHAALLSLLQSQPFWRFWMCSWRLSATRTCSILLLDNHSSSDVLGNSAFTFQPLGCTNNASGRNSDSLDQWSHASCRGSVRRRIHVDACRIIRRGDRQWSLPSGSAAKSVAGQRTGSAVAKAPYAADLPARTMTRPRSIMRWQDTSIWIQRRTSLRRAVCCHLGRWQALEGRIEGSRVIGREGVSVRMELQDHAGPALLQAEVAGFGQNHPVCLSTTACHWGAFLGEDIRVGADHHHATAEAASCQAGKQQDAQDSRSHCLA